MPKFQPNFIQSKRGSISVEFAFIAPVLILMLFGIIGFGTVISVNNGLQQIVAEAARSSVGGLSDTERDQLARAYVSSSTGSYVFIDPTKITITTDDPSSTAFRVSARYDMSDLFPYKLLAGLPLPNPVITRSAVVQRGGF